MQIFGKLTEKRRLQIRAEQDRFREVVLPDEATEKLESQTTAEKFNKYFSSNKDEIILAGLYMLFVFN